MIKRIIALALTILFICFKCLTWVPTVAATGIPAFDAFYYAILQTLGMAYTNGVEMDLAPAIAEVRQAIPDYLQQPDVALKYFLRDYAGKVWDSLSGTWYEAGNDSPYLNNVAAIRIAGNDISTPTLRDIVSQYETKALNLDYEITTPIDSNAIAFWNKYNSLEINNFLAKLNADEFDTPTTNPDLNYLGYLQNINGSGFWFNNFPLENTANGGYLYVNTLGSWSNYSWVAVDNNYYQNNNFCNKVQPYDIIDIYINSNNGVYSFNVSSNQGYLNKVDYYWSGSKVGTSPVFKLFDNHFEGQSIWNSTSINYSFSGTLDQVMNFIQGLFRNVNIYVDGTLWSYAGGTQTNLFNGSTPNAVIDSSTDDGKIVSNPIYWVVDNNTGTPIDSQINLDKLIDYLKGVIDGTNSDTNVDFGDLVDAGVIEKQDGTVISDTDVIAVPVADVIDDAIADTDSIDVPVSAIGDIPPLPPLPPFFPTPDFPEGDPTSGFRGMSVLARIINITNQSLPSDVVLVFYGVIFGAVILGLIKILHK